METKHTEGSRAGRSTRWSVRAPLILAAVLVCLITGLNVDGLLRARSPHNPWEASEVMEGWRSLLGLPVYEAGPDAHATHFYGALAPWVQGEIFRWVGPNNVSGRVLTLVSTVATIVLIVACTRTKGSWFPAILVGIVMFGFNHRSGQYFAENRPDMTSLFFTASAIGLMGLGLEKRRASTMVLGTACLIVGFFFKQPALVYSGVPAVALALKGRRPARSEVLLALVPPVAAMAVVLSLKAFSPTIYYYMIEVPGTYRIEWRYVPLRAWEAMLLSPLFLVMVAEWFALGGGSLEEDRRTRWVVATLAVAICFGAISFAKHGGTANSILPALLAMMAFCNLRLPGALARLEAGAASLPAGALRGGFAALLLLMTVFPPARLREYPPAWDSQYGKVVEAASRLPGTVVCPEDPTIPMYAKRQAGRGLFIELDARSENGDWPLEIPGGVVKEMQAADFVVDMRNVSRTSSHDRLEAYLNERALQGLGFVPVDDLLPDAPSYRIWRRGEAGAAAVASHTAWNSAESAAQRRRSGE